MPISFERSDKSIASSITAKDYSALGTTGLIVAYVATSAAGTFADNSTNTWAQDVNVNAGGGCSFFTFYCVNPTVTSSMDFTYAGGSFYSIVTMGFKVVSAFDVHSSANAPGGFSPGSLTPTAPNDGTSLFVCGLAGNITIPTIDSSFTRANFNDYGAGVNFSSAGAYFIQVASGSKNPTWTPTTGDGGTAMQVFAPGAGGGGGATDLRLGFNPVARLV